ncbi:MAG: N-acetylmuramoyl-L-alanine amidase-like domain-containing protein [Parabacteroides sp.]
MKQKRWKALWVGCCLAGCILTSGRAQETAKEVSCVQVETCEDRQVFARYLQTMPADSLESMGETMLRTARFFLGTPYVAATLEQEPEHLVVNLRQLDCMTFVESVLALSRTVQSGERTFDRFRSELAHIRYRTDSITDYTDRLHYTTDWLYENGRRGVLTDCTQASGGISLPIQLSFMSTHPNAYAQLADHPERVERMRQIEQAVSARSYFYIPQEEIEARSEAFQEGDIVCFVTSIPGLDISHLGIVCRVDGKLTFIHASSTRKEVIVNEASLSDYVKGIRKNIGVMLLRPSAISTSKGISH